eukprot:Filipodium_phascolosomae@DN7744_c0_g1_i1.p1
MNGTILAEDIIREGWLMKQSKHLMEWRRRWCVLTPTRLVTFKKPGSLKDPTEVLYLRSCSTIRSAEEELGKDYAFRVDTPQRCFFLIAESSADKEAWIGHIGRQMIRPTVVEEYDETG